MIVSDIKVANAPAPGENLDEIPQSVSLLPTDLAAEVLNELTEHKYEMAIGIAAAVGNPKRALEDGADAVKAVSGKLGKKDGDVSAFNSQHLDKSTESNLTTSSTDNPNVKWVDENASMSNRARNYDDSATGSRSNIETQKGQAPTIHRTVDNGVTKPVRFDGLDGDVLIDRKLSVESPLIS